MIFVWGLALIGALVVATVARTVLAEVIRAARQGSRIAQVQWRLQHNEGRAPLKWRWVGFKQDFGRYYSSLEIGHFELDHDPSKPARQAW